jgi:DNA-binding protein H-NS
MTKTYTQIQKQIQDLQREAEKLKRAEVEGVIERIQEAIRVYGLTAGDLGLVGSAGRKSNAVAKSRTARSSKMKSSSRAKYRDEAGNEWVGRGPRPQWLRDALAAGKMLDDFAVGPAPAQPARNGKAASPKGAASKSKKGGKVKYSDGTGNSWSGMGPQPRWLKDAIGTGKKLEDFLA